MKFDQLLYDHGRWHYELIETLSCYRQLCSFCSDDTTLHAYLAGNGRPRQLSERGEITEVEDKELDRWKVPIADSIDTAICAYRRQLTVVIVSVTEAAIAEAFEVLFAFKPETMKGLARETQDKELSLATSLDELMAATQLDSLRLSIVDRAVTFATQGRNKQTVLRRIAKLFGEPINTTVSESYLTLVKLRNEIVHDNTKHDISDQEVEQSFETGMSVVEELGRLIAKHGLPIHDPMHIFHNYSTYPPDAAQ